METDYEITGWDVADKISEVLAEPIDFTPTDEKLGPEWTDAYSSEVATENGLAKWVDATLGKIEPGYQHVEQFADDKWTLSDLTDFQVAKWATPSFTYVGHFSSDGGATWQVSEKPATWSPTFGATQRMNDWNPRPDQCPHCLRPFHKGPLTERVKQMFESHSFDPEYDPEADETPILCVGSDHYGPPRPPEKVASYAPNVGTWIIGGKAYSGVGFGAGVTGPQWLEKMLSWQNELLKDLYNWTPQFIYTFKPGYFSITAQPELPQAAVPKKSEVNGEIVQFGKYPVEKVDVYEIDEHISAIQEVADKFGPSIELPDMKSDYTKIVEAFKEKSCGPQNSSAKG